MPRETSTEATTTITAETLPTVTIEFVRSVIKQVVSTSPNSGIIYQAQMSSSLAFAPKTKIKQTRYMDLETLEEKKQQQQQNPDSKKPAVRKKERGRKGRKGKK